MRPLSEQDHYEVLEIPRAAGTDAIERAYRLARSAYADDSLALYSLFSDNDAAQMRERIEAAYRVLSDESLRRGYDENLLTRDPQPEALLAAEIAQSEPAVGVDGGLQDFGDLEEDGGSERTFDGASLRRARLPRLLPPGPWT